MLPSALLPALSTLHTRTTRADRGDSSPFRWSAEVDLGRIMAVLDPDAFDFHVDAQPGYSPYVMGELLGRIRDLGFEPLPDDECEAEILPSGGVRIYLVPVSA